MTPESAKKVHDALDRLDRFMALEPEGPALYQILSGSLRGPDNGAGKQALTMRLRRICFPLTCKQGSTGMMSCDGTPNFDAAKSGGTALLSHYVGHVQHAISYLTQIKRGVYGLDQKAVAAKQEVF